MVLFQCLNLLVDSYIQSKEIQKEDGPFVKKKTTGEYVINRLQ